MSEPQKVLIDAATDAFREVGRTLRERGWPVALIVEAVPERDTFAVSLRFELPHIPIPIERLPIEHLSPPVPVPVVREQTDE